MNRFTDLRAAVEEARWLAEQPIDGQRRAVRLYQIDGNTLTLTQCRHPRKNIKLMMIVRPK